MIPKKIHYCWFGGNPKPDSVQKCINSWKRFCHDYEIIEWNESNFNIHCMPFVEQAIEAKKYAFASDVARLMVVYENGGLYFDTYNSITGRLNKTENTYSVYWYDASWSESFLLKRRLLRFIHRIFCTKIIVLLKKQRMEGV